jgi:hypothetical protein
MPGYFTGHAVTDSARRVRRALGGAHGNPLWPWPRYRAMQAFKTATILMVRRSLFELGHTHDLRFAEMTNVIHP